jgi:hypothetical protein
VVTGISREEILGTSGYSGAFSVFQGKKPVIIDMLDLRGDLLAKECPGAIRVGDSLVVESHIPSPGNGSDMHILGRAGPFFDPAGRLVGYIEGFQDISDMKNAMISLKNLKGRFDNSLNRMMGELEQRSRGNR